MTTSDKRVTHRVAELVLDYDLYPRSEVNSQHVSMLREAFRSGIALPPILIDADSKRVIDGFHRISCLRAEKGNGATIECVERQYANVGDMFVDAMRLNASHGRGLTTHDRVRCSLLAKKYKLGIVAIAAALAMTPTAIKQMGTGRVARSTATTATGHHVPLKRTVKHLAGTQLNDEQVAANDKLSGMDQAFYARQLLLLFRSNMIDRDDSPLIDVLGELRDTLNTFFEGFGGTENPVTARTSVT